jgi:ring-1,2-phenylacetyl-CoA epoxidase subunit PaaE
VGRANVVLNFYLSIMDTWKLRVKDIRPETPDTNAIFLERIDSRPLSYQAGQFLTLLLSFHGRDLRRSYSFSTTPEIDPVAAITIKRVPNGEVSRYLLDHLRVGDILHTLPPAGRFTLDNAAHSLVFIAAGSGIVPVFSLLKAALALQPIFRPGAPTILITQQHDHAASPFHAQLHALTTVFGKDRLRWVEWLSVRDGRLNNWLLEEWILTLLLPVDHPPQAVLPHFYLCGPPAFMRMAQFTLRLLGFPDEQIKKENFTVEYVPPPPLLTDTTPKRVTIMRNDSPLHFEAAWPDTILQAAERHHISLPYSCRGGRCSTCTAKCLSGKVKMSINEVLTEKDLQDGLVLTCVGYAETDLTLTF